MYAPPKFSRKGQNGRLLVIGGGKQYHGAPMFSLLAAKRFVDLIYFCPYEYDNKLIYGIKTIPEVIVLQKLPKLSDFDCVLFGIGVGKKIEKKLLAKIVKESKRLVIDGDGLKHLKNILPKNSIITPHEGEFKMLFGVPGTKENVRKMAQKHNITILKKDPKGDIISNGSRTKINKIHNRGMTKGGTGDVLAGFVAALFCKNNSFDSAFFGAKIVGKAGNSLKKKYGFNFSASDLANELAAVNF